MERGGAANRRICSGTRFVPSLALLLALLWSSFAFGIIQLAPRWMERPEGAEFNPFVLRAPDFFYQDDIAYYGALVRDTADGYARSGAPFLYEIKDRRLPHRTLLTFDLPGLLCYLVSPETLLTLAALLCPPLWIWLGYRVLRQARVGRGWAVAGAIAVLLSYTVTAVFLLPRAEHFSLAAIDSFRPYKYPSRFPVVQWSMLFWLGFLFCALRHARKETRASALALGLSFGLLFHVYAYYWTHAAGLLAVWLGLLLLCRSWQGMKKLAWALLPGALLALPALAELARFLQSDVGAAYMARLGTQYGRIVYVRESAYTLLSLAAMGLLAGGQWRRLLPLFAGVGAYVGLMNAQVITNSSLQNYHWTQTTEANLLVFAAFAAAAAGGRRGGGGRALACVVLAAWTGWAFLSAGRVTAHHCRYAVRTAPLLTLDAGQAEAMAWLREHGDAATVVGTPDLTVAHLLCALTPCNSYIGNYNSPETTETLLDRLFGLWQVYGIDPAFAEYQIGRYGDAALRWTAGPLPPYTDIDLLRYTALEYFYYQKDRPHPADPLPAELAGAVPLYSLPERVRARIRACAGVAGEAAPPAWRCDYLWQGDYERAVMRRDLAAVPWLEPVFASGTVTLYRVKRDAPQH